MSFTFWVFFDSLLLFGFDLESIGCRVCSPKRKKGFLFLFFVFFVMG